MPATNEQIKAHDFPDVYEQLKIDLSTLGCVMLDLDPIPLPSLLPNIELHKSPNEKRFWIDGWVADKTPHVTLLYGLMQQAKKWDTYIDLLLRDWKLDSITIGDVGYFASPYVDEEYYCIVAHVEKTPKLVEGHQRLEMLPHINTFAGYKPHFTIAYIKKDDEMRDGLIAILKKDLVGKEFKVKKGLNLGCNK
jgi:hypothetical protein